MQVEILGVKVNQINFSDTLTTLRRWVGGDKQNFVVTVNPEFLVEAQKNIFFKAILNSAELATCDGFGLSLASIFLRQKNLPRVTGSDLSLTLLKDPEFKIFLLGSTDEVLTEMNNKFAHGNIVGYDSGGTMNSNYELINNSAVIENINTSGANLLLVAFGQVKQETWIYNNLKSMPNIKVAIGIGGTFDFIAGRIKRAPQWLRRIGLEWLYRLINEPARIGRIWNATFVFIWLVIKEKFKKNNANNKV